MSFFKKQPKQPQVPQEPVPAFQKVERVSFPNGKIFVLPEAVYVPSGLDLTSTMNYIIFSLLCSKNRNSNSNTSDSSQN